MYNFAIRMVVTPLIFCLITCHTKRPDPAIKASTDPTSAGYTSDNVPEYRRQIKKQPVAEYRVKTDDPLNDWFFSVRLFETARTFQYLVKLQYEEVKGDDTLSIPNFGFEPKPALVKGKDKYSCIIGFMDKENKFREYKLVSVVGEGEIKLTTLKRYGISRFADGR